MSFEAFREDLACVIKNLTKDIDISEEPPTSNAIAVVNEFGKLEANNLLLEELEKQNSNLYSHTVSVLGPSGAGKSTLIRSLLTNSTSRPMVSKTLGPTSADIHLFECDFSENAEEP